MSRKSGIGFLLAIFLLFCVTPVRADSSVYFGIGLHTASFAKDLTPGKLISISPGPGAALNVGFKLTSGLALDVRAGRTFQKELYSNTRVNYDWIEAGPLLHFFGSRKTHPFVSAGVGKYKVNTTGLDVEGVGIFANLGIEETVSESVSARLYLQGSRWEDTDLDLNVEAFNVGLLFNLTL